MTEALLQKGVQIVLNEFKAQYRIWDATKHYTNMFVIKDWQKYGLRVFLPYWFLHLNGKPRAFFRRERFEYQKVINAIRAHLLVMDYLDIHPRIRKKYKKDQTGEVKYFHVLTMAENEYGIKVEQNA